LSPFYSLQLNKEYWQEKPSHITIALALDPIRSFLISACLQDAASAENNARAAQNSSKSKLICTVGLPQNKVELLPVFVFQLFVVFSTVMVKSKTQKCSNHRQFYVSRFLQMDSGRRRLPVCHKETMMVITALEKTKGEVPPVYEIIKQADRCFARHEIEKKMHMHKPTTLYHLSKYLLSRKRS
jgi:hypothetical protein